MMLARGDVIEGRYVVEALLGTGGMAQVWRVRHARKGTLHALKLLHNRHPTLRARMLREGRLQGRLHHPNVVAVSDVIQYQGAPGLIIEYVKGPTLSRFLASERPSPEQIDALASGIFEGVIAAHEAGLIHRDLKPDNILLSREDGERLLPKIADFGIARLMTPDSAAESLTRTGIAMGTPAYMAPEQIRDARSCDERADLWALGCVLYEMVCGVRPFSGEDNLSLLQAVSEGRYLPPREHVPGELTPRWEAAIHAALVRDPESRVRTCRELAAIWGQGVGAAIWSDAWLSFSEPTWDPSAETQGPSSPTFPDEPGLVSTLPPRRHNLPTDRDTFVGRAAEIEGLAERFERGARLVSVLGIGGTGKTRLVARFGLEHQASWPGGVWFCDLSEARDAQGICAAVAQGLDVPLALGSAAVQLGHAIAGRGRCLILLDNFEQVARYAVETLGRWLDRAGEAAFVVTSREVLGLRGEETLALPPLSEADAVALFEDRARAANDAFTQATPGPLRELVRLLDRLPLAIELAAARTRLMSVESMLSRMGDRFRLLTSRGGRRTRQSTLRATLDWSWELLEGWEQAALAQVSVFEGGFTLEAAEAVIDLSEFDDAPWPMDAVQSLVDKSLLRVVDSGDSDLERLDLLLSVQTYAAEKLGEAGSFPELRHMRHYAAYGSPEARRALRGPGGPALWRANRRELDNLQIANLRAAACGEAAIAAATAEAIWAVQKWIGPIKESCVVLERSLALPTLAAADRASLLVSLGMARWRLGQEAPALAHLEEARALGEGVTRASALGMTGDIHRDIGRSEEAAAAYDASLAICRAIGARESEGFQLQAMARLHLERGEIAEGFECIQEALAIQKTTGNVRFLASTLLGLGNLQTSTGDYDEARATLARCRAAHQAFGDRRSEGSVLNNLAILDLYQGELASARRLLEKALTLHREAGSRVAEGNTLGNLGHIAWQQGDAERAIANYEQVVVICEEVGNRRGLCICHAALGTVQLAQGNREAGIAEFEQSLAIAREVNDRRGESTALRNLGVIAMYQERFEESGALIEEALAISTAIKDRQNIAMGERNLGDLRAAEGAHDVAIARYSASLLLYRELAQQNQVGELLGLVARVHLAAGRAQEARSSLEEAGRLLSGTESPTLLADLSEIRAELEAREAVTSGTSGA